MESLKQGGEIIGNHTRIKVVKDVYKRQGKKLYDKRDDIAKKDQRREAERNFKVKNLY